MLDPRCESCGGHLRAVRADQLERAKIEDAEVPHVAQATKDATGLFAGLMVLPWFLPIVGVNLGDVAFVVPFVLFSFAAQRCAVAARREPAWGACWWSLAAAAAVSALASAVAVASAIVAEDVGDLAFYIGIGASVAFLAAALVLLAQTIRAGVGWERLIDGVLLCLVVGAVTVYYVVRPGIAQGDGALTLVVLLDLGAFAAAAVAAAAREGRRVGEWWLVAGLGVLIAGDSVVAAVAAGGVVVTPALTALLWAVCAYSVASAAEAGLTAPPAPALASPGTTSRRWVLARVVLPLLAVLTHPVVASVEHFRGKLDGWSLVFFGISFLVSLVLAFGRQALLLVAHQRNVVRERRLRHEAMQRNEELEALTGLATTMTQTLEEAPIVEQALGVLAAAARASSAALHTVDEDGRPTLAAATGAWHTEHVWACTARPDDRDLLVYARGGRSVMRVALTARGHRIGTVTLLRSAAVPFDERSVALLRLLVDQMAVAVQNARDYREKLEQAIRDPLTGLYNRRFLLETLEKEVQRAARYGSEASLVIFDVDDFKGINDAFGHATGDEVLRRIGALATSLIRPVDSFARIGGEEFALLMPETSQMEALLVAERLRASIGRHELIPERRVTVSGGVASCPIDTLDADELQRKADAALYWAKRNGRDLCAVASEVSLSDDDGVSDRAIAHLNALVALMDESCLQTRHHSENVATYAVALGQELGLDGERIIGLRRAAMLHDIGKVAVDAAILDKPAALTDEEYALVQTHSDVGSRIVARAGLTEEASWVRAHHERFDGRGYPDGLAGTDIPLHARIIFVADSFEAMTSDRPYRRGMAVADALAELRACAGTQFDPEVVAAMERLVNTDRLAVMALRSV